VYHIHVFREGSSLRPTSAGFEVPLAGMWMESLIIVRQVLKNTEPAAFWQCSCTAYRTFSVGLLRTKFQATNLLFSNLCQHVDENITYQQLQTICREKVCRIKAFRANLEKFGRKILCTPKKSLFPTPMGEILKNLRQKFCKSRWHIEMHLSRWNTLSELRIFCVHGFGLFDCKKSCPKHILLRYLTMECVLAQGWANIFFGGPHWRFYCYRGPHARITYITSIIALKTLKKFCMGYHKVKVTIATSGWVKMRFRMKRVEKKLDNSNLIHKITLIDSKYVLSMNVWLPCGPHKKPSRAACGPRAVVCPPLF